MELRETFLLVLAVLCQPALQFSLRSRLHETPTKLSRNYDGTDAAKYKYQIKTIDMPVDHFSFSVQDTFKMRYLVNDTWQKKEDAPIFFYTGNEGSIETFAENTGFMWEIAPKFNALLVFAEHRYYGESMPFGNKSYADPQHLGYLTSQQALADYVDLIQYLRTKNEYKHSPVIVFGGSYGGMLSAWMRMKYPHIVQGAIAASAPILQFTGVTTCEAFSRIITSDFAAARSSCPVLIRKSWSIISKLGADDKEREWLSSVWKLCQPLKNSTDVEEFKSFLEDVYGNLAMVNYPYPTNFLAPLPANPINVVCSHLTNTSLGGKDLIMSLQKAVSVYTNYTGKTTCLAISDATPSLDAAGWPYQACTEMVMPICTDGRNDMFEPQPWNLEKYSGECMKKFSTTPRPHLVCEQYGCNDLSTATNIVFSNGLMDPWSSGGVLMNLSASAVAILIPEAAHHLDLRASDANDPHSVTMARKYHHFFIKSWIKEYRLKEERLVSL